MSWYFLLICMIRSADGTGLGGAYALNALLALWLIVLGDDAYMDKWFILLWYGYELFRWFLGLHSWYLDQICGWSSNGAYMVIFIRIRRSTYLEFTSSLIDDESLICFCRHMHKDHILQLWCRIPIVLGTYMDEDCWLDTWMIVQSCIVGDMMMMSSYLYDDRLLCTYVDWYSQLMIHGPCRSVWLWCFTHMI